MKKIILSLFLILAGCATSSTHVGVFWGHQMGMVSESDATKSSKFVDEFHDNLANERWEAAYLLLDTKIQKLITQSDLKHSFEKLHSTYGDEGSFGLTKNEPAELLHRISNQGQSCLHYWCNTTKNGRGS